MGWSSKREDDLERYRDGLRTRKEALSRAFNTTFSTLSKHAFEDKVLLGKLEILLEQFNGALGEIESMEEFLTDASNEGILSNLGLKKLIDEKDAEIARMEYELERVRIEDAKVIKDLRCIVVEREQKRNALDAERKQVAQDLKREQRLVEKAVKLHPGLEYDLYDRPNPYKEGDCP